MDYLKNHKKISLAEYEKMRDYIISQLKNSDAKGLMFSEAMTNLKNLIHKEFIDKNIAKKYPYDFGRSLTILQFPYFKYNPKKVDPVIEVLKNLVYEDFKSTLVNFKDRKIELDYIDNLSFESFYPEILKLVVYYRCYSRIDVDFPHIVKMLELFYDKDNYDEFSIKFLQDDADKLNEDDFRKVFKKFHKKFPTEITPKSKIVDDVEISKYLVKYKTQIDKIDDNEMALLFYICTSSNSNFDRSELIKLILICGNINNDFKIFDSSSANSTLYNKIIKAHKPDKDKEKWYSFIDNIINKIEIFKLPKTSEILLNMK